MTPYLILIAGLVLVFLLGLHIGEKHGVRVTEERWTESANRAMRYYEERVRDHYNRAVKAEQALVLLARQHAAEALARKAGQSAPKLDA